MWSIPSLKTPASGGLGRLSQADSQHFCCLAMVPMEEELKQLQLNLATFEDKAKTLELVTQQSTHIHTLS
jgi:hypothetical protein